MDVWHDDKHHIYDAYDVNQWHVPASDIHSGGIKHVCQFHATVMPSCSTHIWNWWNSWGTKECVSWTTLQTSIMFGDHVGILGLLVFLYKPVWSASAYHTCWADSERDSTFVACERICKGWVLIRRFVPLLLSGNRCVWGSGKLPQHD
jgi:hypothetical protein